MLPSLPPEVLREILDHVLPPSLFTSATVEHSTLAATLLDAQRTLAACCLANRQLLPIAQSVLYSTLVLDDARHNAVEDALPLERGDAMQHHRHTSAELLRTLERNPMLGRKVRQIALTSTLLEANEAPVDKDVWNIRNILACCHNVTRVSMKQRRQAGTIPLHPDVPIASPLVDGLEALDIRPVLANLIHFDLTFRHFDIQEWRQVEVALGGMRNLSSLSVGCGHITGIRRSQTCFQNSSPPTFSLRYLEYDHRVQQHTPFLFTPLSASSHHSLRTLKMTFPPSPAPDLSLFRNLACLELESAFPFTDSTAAGVVEMAANLPLLKALETFVWTSADDDSAQLEQLLPHLPPSVLYVKISWLSSELTCGERATFLTVLDDWLFPGQVCEPQRPLQDVRLELIGWEEEVEQLDNLVYVADKISGVDLRVTRLPLSLFDV